MDDLISRQAAIDAIYEMHVDGEDGVTNALPNTYGADLREIINQLCELPSADAVEIIRCKDCKWFGKLGCAIEIVDDSDKPKEDDYCSFAERKDDEEHT